MARYLPPLNALRAFEAAARRLSFRLAAEELCLTPSAISRHVKVLEDALGVALFERGYRKVRLTAAGESYAGSIEGLFDRISDASAVVSRRAPKVVPRPLIVSAYPTFALRWLAARWIRFLGQHAHLDARFFTTTRAPDLYRDQCDVAIWFGGTPPPNHASARLAPADVSPLCAPALCVQPVHPLRCVRDLATQTLLHSNLRALDWRVWLEAAVASGEASAADISNIDPDRGVRLENANLAYQGALAGGGVVIGFNLLLADDIEAGRLVAPFRTVRRSGRSFWLIWRNERKPDRRVQQFRKWIESEVSISMASLAHGRQAALGATRKP